MFGSWSKILSVEDVSPILGVLDLEYEKYNIFPQKKQVFEAFRQCPYDATRVVIIGQDPYPQAGFATGIAFANPPGIRDISPSLDLLRERLFKDYGVRYSEFDQTLLSWEKQGVLLLNSSLTVREGRPGSHTHLWAPFIQLLIKKLNEYNSGIIYVLLGNVAAGFARFIGPNNYILKYPHPAYFARLGCGFNCTMFTDINHKLKELNGDEINF